MVTQAKRLLLVLVAAATVLMATGCPKPATEQKPTRPSTTAGLEMETPSERPQAPVKEESAEPTAPSQTEPAAEPGQMAPTTEPAAEEKAAEK
ncbi:MAG TPA: hypothetical protein PKI05_10740, partial [Thermogutta sp.]|nr:hypothetical protein [Thermogutta sp.]